MGEACLCSSASGHHRTYRCRCSAADEQGEFRYTGSKHTFFILSIALCVAVFFATLRYKVNPILALLVCGIVGLVVY